MRRANFASVLDHAAAEAVATTAASPIPKSSPLQADLSASFTATPSATLRTEPRSTSARRNPPPERLAEARQRIREMGEELQRLKPVNSFQLGQGDPYLAATPQPAQKGMGMGGSATGRGVHQNMAKHNEDTAPLPIARPRAAYHDPSRTDAATGDVSDDRQPDVGRTRAFDAFLASKLRDDMQSKSTPQSGQQSRVERTQEFLRKLDELRGDTTQNTTPPSGRRLPFTGQNPDLTARRPAPKVVVQRNQGRYARIMSNSMRDQTILGGADGARARRPPKARPPKARK